ncbi:uncharacterized protein JN550_003025 [Neoarthrinium moseri]|uniref:uncharacterized protein n=1 Tax=Neoarthrinium moseri TaxID=1658444 RepID=UPI001FDE4246|nr:uncharacterized protein JN550_003025 [Neoarthrinium moseri]KAI1873756.1 hypothetical protein JN550_003025 [Neoarthrinium moseri]
MQFFTSTKAILAVLAAQTALASPTNPEMSLNPRGPYCWTAGAVNGQCGQVWDFENCSGKNLQQIAPDCKQTCRKAPAGAKSIMAWGDGTYGTTCYMYEDENCTQEIRRTSNTIESSCATPVGQTIRSYKCLAKC